jgi:hypothetical protein
MRFSTILTFCLAALVPTFLAAPVVNEEATPAKAIPKVGTCPITSAPAFPATQEALKGLLQVHKLSLFAVTQDRETTNELTQAALFQVETVRKLVAEAEAANKSDTSEVRRLFFLAQHDLIRADLFASEKILKAGLPSFPWLGKAYNWLNDSWKKVKNWWTNLWGNKGSDAAAPNPQEAAKADQIAKDFEKKIKEVADRIAANENAADECAL